MSEELEEILKVPQADKSDIFHAMTKFGISVAPSVGGAIAGIGGCLPFEIAGTVLAELFGTIITPSLQSRNENWMRVVSIMLIELYKEKDLNADKLKANEPFITLFIESTNAVLKTHIHERITMYRNLLKNSVVDDYDYFEASKLLKFINELHPVQIEILNILENDSQINKHPESLNDFLTELNNSDCPKLISAFSPPNIEQFRTYLSDLRDKNFIYLSALLIDDNDIENHITTHAFLTGFSDKKSLLPFFKLTPDAISLLKIIKK